MSFRICNLQQSAGQRRYSQRTKQNYQDTGVAINVQMSTIRNSELLSTPAYSAALALDLKNVDSVTTTHANKPMQHK